MFKSILFFTAFTSALGVSSVCLAGKEAGNGGKAAVCRDEDGKITNVTMFDLERGKNHLKFPMNIPESKASVNEQIETALERVRFMKKFHSQLSKAISDLKEPPLLFVKRLVNTKDSGNPKDNKKYLASDCSEEQLANQTEAGYLLIKDELYHHPSFSNTSKAAFWVHEGLNRLSSKYEIKDTVPIQEFTAYLFSDRFEESLFDLLYLKAFPNAKSPFCDRGHYALIDPNGSPEIEVYLKSNNVSLESIVLFSLKYRGEIIELKRVRALNSKKRGGVRFTLPLDAQSLSGSSLIFEDKGYLHPNYQRTRYSQRAIVKVFQGNTEILKWDSRECGSLLPEYLEMRFH